MSKELTPLEALERLRPKTTYSPYYTRSEKRYYCDIIKKALKDYEMEHTLRIRLENANYELVREKQENDKKLKAFEIIKDIGIKISTDENVGCLYIHITNDKIIVLGYVYGKEKVDLLKEVLL